MVSLPRIRCRVSGRSSTSGASSAPATIAPIAVLSVTCAIEPGCRPSRPASGDAATAKALTAISAIRTRCRASRCGQPTFETVNSASTMPAANHEKNAGGQFHRLWPDPPSKGMCTQNRLATAAARMIAIRARTGTRRDSSASSGNTR